ncbi:MAG: hypothetical protein A2831_02155 [Candidatus Yanofskybacteria bacterium RIFCSPHIGHO2_01_FULL_44_17]|uniref:Uncharacterized protein n=1 Tax=Candidatus Yanofskybacteria bacterium RIFCSPHIGHO2_01_FULL_44_17 TaxID=1802668 RepID=A0A1F8ES17_9BACT|nr:MAG: hypothetical protein A2831_02155 [Candidatus Yanofskybacteria bacterium RIFCSPHIGHO2_01_FULL_44_17]
MSEAHTKLALILRTKPEVLLDLEQKMDKLTGKSGIIEKIAEENRMLVGRTLQEFGLEPKECSAKRVYDALIQRLTHMDKHLYNFLGKPDLSKMSAACGKLCETALTLNKPATGLFIKKEVAVKMLEKFPPNNLLDHFGHKSVAELVEKQGFESVFSALRFAQDQKWMHEFFDKAYDGLTTNDFEEREVVLKVLEPEWLDVAEKFLEKKYHNVSHLKEFGVIFVIPLTIDTPGETLRLFTLMLHYLNEVPFYSKLFRKFSLEKDFTTKLKSLLRGDVPEGQKPDENSFRIVQRYLAKDDVNDFRLLEPHINPEAEHWYKAEGDLAKLSGMVGAEGHAFGYWQGLDFVGDFFHDGISTAGDEELIAFDLIDLVMSLVKKGEIKYLYHQQEALWNKIFIEYLGRDRVNELVEENIIGGFVRL